MPMLEEVSILYSDLGYILDNNYPLMLLLAKLGAHCEGQEEGTQTEIELDCRS